MSKLDFFTRDRSSASLRISTSRVFPAELSLKLAHPRLEPSELGVAGHAIIRLHRDRAPSVISLRQRYRRFGAAPSRRATAEMLAPG